MIPWSNVWKKAAGSVVVFSALCGIIYPAVVTGVAQAAFSKAANGSIIEVNGVKYGSEVVGQPFKDPGHLWGRVTKMDTSSFKDSDDKPLLYGAPSNLTPTGEDLGKAIKERAEAIQKANPDRAGVPVPVELVTNSGSGLDPDISPAAAEYQVPRIAKARKISEDQVRQAISANTTGRFLGFLGEPRVNVLKVNLTLDGILKADK